MAVLLSNRVDTDELAAFRSQWREELARGKTTEQEDHEGSPESQQTDTDANAAHTKQEVCEILCRTIICEYKRGRDKDREPGNEAGYKQNLLPVLS